ncbi:MAG: ATP-binding protein [Planctomycetota bacterium]|jgi:nitrate/nitrite-specific signal transduction histidine kinase
MGPQRSSVPFKRFSPTWPGTPKLPGEEVILKESAAFLTLQVQDNGRGITDNEIHSPKSIGLLGIQEWARLRAGEIQFQGTPGKGITVTVRLPLSMNNTRLLEKMI